jgi:prephenate dehydrogenase
MRWGARGSSSSNYNTVGGEQQEQEPQDVGRLEQLKQREAELVRALNAVRRDKRAFLRQRPLTIGIIGFGRFGQFMARTFVKQHHKVVATSRSDYSDIARGMGVIHIDGMDLPKFLQQNLDVIVLSVSIMSFQETIQKLASSLQEASQSGLVPLPLVVDVLSVKEHPRNIMLTCLPQEVDILCSHPMFGPDSAQHGWNGLNFVYERTRIDGIVWDQEPSKLGGGKEVSTHEQFSCIDTSTEQKDGLEQKKYLESHTEGTDRLERFLSIWEEEGCRMVPLSCVEHDTYAANSQFITHLMDRILGKQGLSPTPIDTKGFESVLKLVQTTTADSFDLFYGLYKYNPNSMNTVNNLKAAMDDVVVNLKKVEEAESSSSS